MARTKTRKIKAKKPQKKAKGRERPRAIVEAAYEEVTYTCASCGRYVTMIKVPGLDVSHFLCQRCEKGEGGGFEEED